MLEISKPSNTQVVQEYERAVIFRLGRYMILIPREDVMN